VSYKLSQVPGGFSAVASAGGKTATGTAASKSGALDLAAVRLTDQVDWAAVPKGRDLQLEILKLLGLRTNAGSTTAQLAKGTTGTWGRTAINRALSSLSKDSRVHSLRGSTGSPRWYLGPAAEPLGSPDGP